MNPTELFLADGRSAGVFFCGACRMIYRSGERDMAVACCRPTLCACGAECDKGWTICRTCRALREETRAQERWDKAQKLAAEAVDGMVYNEDADAFHDDVESAIEAWYDEHDEPPRLYACRGRRMDFDVGALLEWRLDEHHEDAQDEIPAQAVRELEAFLDAWAKEHGPVTYEPDYTRAILVPPNPHLEHSTDDEAAS